MNVLNTKRRVTVFLCRFTFNKPRFESKHISAIRLTGARANSPRDNPINHVSLTHGWFTIISLQSTADRKVTYSPARTTRYSR